MKQILQDLQSGETLLVNVPAPACPSGCIKIRTSKSLISAGTERMLVEFSQGGLLSKARSQPEKVRQVIDKIKSDGLIPTLDTVFKRLGEPMPLGYCNAGKVIEVGREASGFKIGDMVASNGPHAEVVCVPTNLCAKIPNNVTDDQACFTVLGAIGLQGVRLVNPTFGEKIVVFGTGLIGLITLQLLRACGCETLGIDVNEFRLNLAKSFHARVCNSNNVDPVAFTRAWTEGVGVDGVIIAASAKADDIVHQAAEMCRKRGRIVLVGTVGLNLQRADFYEKELSFQVSCSYGPGRYDESYEKMGRDYPLGYVRWTEQRNFQAVLRAMSSGQLDVSSLISDQIDFDNAQIAYTKALSDVSALGMVLNYPNRPDMCRTIISHNRIPGGKSGCVAAMIGTGNFAKIIMAPALARSKARLKYVSTRTNSAAARYIGEKYGFENYTTDNNTIWNDPDVNTVFISTRHNSHADMVLKALVSGKHTFVEKPLCLTLEELKKIRSFFINEPSRHSTPPTVDKAVTNGKSGNRHDSSLHLMVGFNRRYSPHVQKSKELLADRSEPLAITFTCNAGIISPDVWVHDRETGGGRIIGEACHFIDLISYITESQIESVAAYQMGQGVAIKEDKMSIILRFVDGSIGTINYFGNGSKQFPKETMSIFSEGRVLHVDNFLSTRGYGFKRFKKFKTRWQDKGHYVQFSTFVERITFGGDPLIGLDEMINSTLASFAAVTSAIDGRMVHLAEEYRELFMLE